MLNDASKERPISGGCACRAVRYRITGPISFSFQCHCRKCQKATGSGHASAFAVERQDTEIEGPAKDFPQPSDSGFQTHSTFCPNCGSPLFSRTERFPDRLYFYVSTLDDPSAFAPQFAVFQEQAQPWDQVPEALQSSAD